MDTESLKCSRCGILTFAGPNDPCKKCGGVLLPSPPAVGAPATSQARHTSESTRYFWGAVGLYAASPIGCVVGLIFEFPPLLAVSLFASLFFVIIGSACLICSVIADDHRRT